MTTSRTFAHEYDVIIASPSICTGIDLNIPGVFSAVAAFLGGVLPVDEALQFLARLRDPDCPREIWVKNGYTPQGQAGNGSTFAKGLLDGASSKLKGELIEVQMVGEQTRIDGSWLTLWARLGGHTNQGYGDYRKSILGALEAQGSECLGRVLAWEDGEIQGEIANEIAEKNAQKIIDAPDIDKAQAETLNRKESLTPGERAQLQKWKLGQRYGIAPSLELIALANTIGYSALRLGWLLNQDTSTAESLDRALAESLGDGAWIPSLARKTQAQKIKMLKAIGLPDIIDRPEEFTGDDYQDWLEKCLQGRSQIKNVLGISVNEKTSPIIFIRNLLKLVGRSLDSRKSNGQRVYRVSPIPPTISQIYGGWDSQNEVYQLDTKQGQSLYINDQKSQFVPVPESDSQFVPESVPHKIQEWVGLHVLILKGRWAGIMGKIESEPAFTGLGNVWRVWVATAQGCKSIVIDDLATC